MNENNKETAFVILNKYLNKYDDLSFIGFAITPWQANGIDAFIHMLEEEGKFNSGLVILSEHKYTGKCITNENFLPHDNIHMIEIKDGEMKFGESRISVLELLERLRELKKNTKYEQYVYVLNAGKLNLKWLKYLHKHYKRGVKFVLIDDGTGGYNGYRGTQKLEIIKRVIYNYCLKVLYKQNCFIDNRLFCVNNKKFGINRKVAEHYEYVYKQVNNNIDDDLLSRFDGKLVLNTQCLFDSNEISGEQDVNVFRILYTILRQIGVEKDVIIKPHPREKSLHRYDEFKWDVLKDCPFSQEEIIAKLTNRPKCIVGITSSSLVNLNALFGIRTISLAKLFLNQNISNGMKKDVQDFISLFSDIVEMPSNEDELRKIIIEMEDK